jgi:hypothetical protein
MKFLTCNSVILAALYCMAVSTAFMNVNNMNVQPRCAARSNDVVLQAHASDSGSLSRARFLSTFAAAAASVAVGVSGSIEPADAADKVDPAVKGTKKDPGYESCVSQCMYDCTKPKGMEQKSRSECLKPCKKECATTKAQLMVGTPAV